MAQDLSSWLLELKLEEYMPLFEQHNITSSSQLAGFDEAALVGLAFMS